MDRVMSKKPFDVFLLNLVPERRIYKRDKNALTKSISRTCNSIILKFENVSLNSFVRCEICDKMNLH